MFVAVPVPPIDNVFYVDLGKTQLDIPDHTFDAVNAWEDLENFRRSGELNKWLYDYFSLTLLLRKTGFCDVSRKTYRTSDIPDWNRFDLDRSSSGDHPIEPSLYMEAYKPPDSALLQSPARADIFTQP
jgi:hypothetical protein